MNSGVYWPARTVAPPPEDRARPQRQGAITASTPGQARQHPIPTSFSSFTYPTVPPLSSSRVMAVRNACSRAPARPPCRGGGAPRLGDVAAIQIPMTWARPIRSESSRPAASSAISAIEVGPSNMSDWRVPSVVERDYAERPGKPRYALRQHIRRAIAVAHDQQRRLALALFVVVERDVANAHPRHGSSSGKQSDQGPHGSIRPVVVEFRLRATTKTR